MGGAEGVGSRRGGEGRRDEESGEHQVQKRRGTVSKALPTELQQITGRRQPVTDQQVNSCGKTGLRLTERRGHIPGTLCCVPTEHFCTLCCVPTEHFRILCCVPTEHFCTLC